MLVFSLTLYFGGLAAFVFAWRRGLPPAPNHSRIWERAKLECEIRDQLANAETPSPTGMIQFHAAQYAQGAQHDHA